MQAYLAERGPGIFGMKRTIFPGGHLCLRDDAAHGLFRERAFDLETVDHSPLVDTLTPLEAQKRAAAFCPESQGKSLFHKISSIGVEVLIAYLRRSARGEIKGTERPHGKNSRKKIIRVLRADFERHFEFFGHISCLQT